MKYLLLALILSSCGFKGKNTGFYYDLGDCSHPVQIVPRQNVTLLYPFTQFSTGRPSEELSCLPAPFEIGAPFTLYSIDISGVSRGDILQTNFIAEVTEDLEYESVVLMIAWYIRIERDGILEFPSAGHGTNVQYKQHHLTFSDALDYTFQESGKYTIKVSVYAALGEVPDVSNAHFTVNQGYGYLQGIVTKKVWQ